MADNSKKISELPVTTTLSANDRIVVLVSPGTANATVQTITSNNLAASSYQAIPGPYDSDVAAGGNNVPVHGIYYDASGVVKLRLS